MHCWWERKMVQSLWTGVQHPHTLNKHPPDDWVIPVLAIYPRENKAYSHTKTCTQIFVAAIFVMATNWKQLKYPSTLQQVSRYTNCCVSITLSNKTEWIIDAGNNEDPSLNNNAEWEKSGVKEYILYHFLSIKLKEEQTTLVTANRSLEAGGREAVGQGETDFKIQHRD